MPTRSSTVLSAFTGLGGLDIGLESAGFEVVGCIETDSVARLSLKANRDGWRLLEPGDIAAAAATLKPVDLGMKAGQLTLLAGAPPCQPYSKAAMWAPEAWQGFADPRAKPLVSFIELVERFQPRAVLLENVPGFVSGPHSIFPRLEDAFRRINSRVGTEYRLETRVLDAADFGVPQHRRRAIVVALRDAEAVVWPSPTHAEKPVRVWDALAGLDIGETPATLGKWAKLLPSIPEGQNYLWHTARGGGLPLFGYRTRYWSFLLKLAKNQPSWTLPAQPGPSVGPFHWTSRPLTAKESMRLQTFPIEWVVEGRHREQILQIGNATPPLLGEVLGRAILVALDKNAWPSLPTLTIPRQEKVPSASKPASVPKQFLDLVGEHPDHPGAGEGPKPRPKAFKPLPLPEPPQPVRPRQQPARRSASA